MNFRFVNYADALYKKGVEIRVQQFFNEFENPINLIEDEFEKNSLHLVCVSNEDVLGTGRLTISKEIGIISQMAVKDSFQKKGLGSKILITLIEKCKEEKAYKIQLSARQTAIKFYNRFEFKEIGEKYPSKKTGIIHQLMIKNIA